MAQASKGRGWGSMGSGVDNMRVLGLWCCHRRLRLHKPPLKPSSNPTPPEVGEEDWTEQFELFGCVIGFAILHKETIPVHFGHNFLRSVSLGLEALLGSGDAWGLGDEPAVSEPLPGLGAIKRTRRQGPPVPPAYLPDMGREIGW